MPVDISIVVPFHGEGRVVPRTLNALSRSANFARRKGLSVEAVAVLDRVTDKITSDVLDRLQELEGILFSKYEADLGALSLSRNYGISRAKGEYISILDGDDLYSEEWLYRAYNTCSLNSNRIAHPELLYLFPIETYLKFYNTGKQVLLNLLIGNQWSALSFAHRSIFEKIPYVIDTDCYAFQDWLWNCHTAEAGYEHVLVPGTLMAVRQSPPGKSLWQGSYRKNKVVRPNIFFRKLFLREIPDLFEDQAPGNKEGNYLSRALLFAVDRIGPLMDRLYENQPRLHQAIIDFKRSLAHSLRAVRNPDTVPPWVRREIGALSLIEPTLEHNPKIRTRLPNHFSIVEAITPGMSRFVEDPSAAVFILDRLEPYDYVQKALCYMKAVSRPVYVLTTVRSSKNQLDLLPESGVHIDIGNLRLGYEERIKFMHRLLLESRPAFIHITRSKPAFEMLTRYRATFEGIRVVASIYSPDDAYEPDFIGWELRRYPDLVDHLACLATDTSFFRQRVINVFGPATCPVVHHRFPFAQGPFRRPQEPCRHVGNREEGSEFNGDTIRVLWAGRWNLFRKKRWATRLSRSLKNYPQVSFHILDTFRTKTLGTRKYFPWFGNGRGRDAGIDLASFHMLVLLSEVSGAFCLLLRAMGKGIPVLALKSHFTEELVGQERGWLLQSMGWPNDSLRVVMECLNDPIILKEKGAAARQFTSRWHHWDGFKRQVKEFYQL